MAFADKILMNKVDLVSKADLLELKKTVSSINSFAEQIETVRLFTTVTVVTTVLGRSRRCGCHDGYGGHGCHHCYKQIEIVRRRPPPLCTFPTPPLRSARVST